MAKQQEKNFPPPVDWDEMYPGRFIKAADFKGRVVTVTVESVKIEELIGDKGPQIKGLLSFVGKDKSLALNKTNGICIKSMFGRRVQQWVGKRISLFAGTHDGEPCIRVYGSPDIDADMVVEVALPRKRPINMTMHRVQLKGAAPATAQATGQPTPPPPSTAAPTPTEPEPALAGGGIGDLDDDIPF